MVTTSYETFDMAMRVILPLAIALLYGAVLWMSLQRNWFARLLELSMFRPIARYAYGIYIVHFLLMPTFEAAFGPKILARYFRDSDFAIYSYFLIASCISFLIAMLSYHMVERHFLRLKRV